MNKLNARVLRGYTMRGRQVDVVETSRGCTFDCSFCSLIAMRGRQFYTYSLDRVLADIPDARDHWRTSDFLIDDTSPWACGASKPFARRLSAQG